jgi:hypothetical protein
MKAWSHLPNAAHIDWVLKDIKAHPDRWDAAYASAWDAAYASAWDAVRNATPNATPLAALGAAWDAVRNATPIAAYSATRGATLALIAYDDCAYILDLPCGAVRLMASTGHPAAVLLYPATLAKNFKESHHGTRDNLQV